MAWRGLSKTIVLAVASVTLLLGVASVPASAQGRDSHWGVVASFTPTWTADDGPYKEGMLNLEGEGTVEGSEFTIGIARGSTLGGDWGVSFVNKPIEDGSGTTIVEDDGFTETRTTQGVKLQGVEFHWSKPFVTIAERVQIGITIGGGVAQPDGVIIETQSQPFTIPPGVPANFVQQICLPYTEMGMTCGFSNGRLSSTGPRPADEVMMKWLPLVKAEVAAGAILAPGLKVRFSGGVNMPSYITFRISGVYLFGAR